MRGTVTGGLMIGTALLLAACGDSQPEDAGAATGGGEVLEGTVSDAMLPLATVTSQPPLAPPEIEPEQATPAPTQTDAAPSAPDPAPTGEGTPAPAGAGGEEAAD